MPLPGTDAARPCDVAPPGEADRAAALARLDRLARLLDSAIRLPGTRVTLGLDAGLNLLPGIGPACAKALSAWIILEAWRIGAPGRVVLRMAGHVAPDALVGAVPLAGWVGDVFIRANARNLALLRAELARDAPPDPAAAAGPAGLGAAC